MGVDPTYIRTRFIATEEATTPAAYKKMIVSSTAKDIVYTFLFSGVHGSYLRGSIINLDLDSDNLPEGDKSTMDFGGGGGSKAKVWKTPGGPVRALAACRIFPPPLNWLIA